MRRPRESPEGDLGPVITTLPVHVQAQAEELLLGLTLRIDLANGFPAGSTCGLIGRHDAGVSSYGRPGLSITGRVFYLERLADLLGWPVEGVLATTFRRELERLFGTDVPSKRLGHLTGFRICPACVSESLLVRRETILPWVDVCGVHGTALVRECRCGVVLQPTSSGQEPFHCARCWSFWGSLPRSSLPPVEGLRQRRVLHAYRVLLERGDERLPARLRQLAELDGPPRWDTGWSVLPFNLEQIAASSHDLRSLASYAAALVVREIPPERVFEPLPADPRELLSCHNTACGFFDRTASMRLNGLRPNGAESYCADCGSRYIGQRMILTFDVEHGGQVHERVVAAARARLGLLHERLAGTCDLLKPPSVVHIGHVFRAAGVPNARYLRARRLGLVQLVQYKLGRSVKLDADCFTLDPSDRWDHGRAMVGSPRQRPGPTRRDR